MIRLSVRCCLFVFSAAVGFSCNTGSTPPLPIGKFACETGFGGNTTIESNDRIIVGLSTNQIWIVASAKLVADNEYELYFVEPEDLGRGGMQIAWDQISTDKPIGTLTVLNDSTLVKADIGLYHLGKQEYEHYGVDWNACDTIHRSP